LLISISRFACKYSVLPKVNILPFLALIGDLRYKSHLLHT
jgi:hypothetical protein